MNKLACVAVLLATLCLAADTPEANLPAKAILPTRAYNTAMAQAKARYEREAGPARAEYVRAMERAKAEYMRDGDLAGATAVQELIGEDVGSSPVTLLGVWSFDGHTVSFLPDGSAARSSVPNDRGRWRAIHGAARDYQVSFPGGQAPDWVVTVSKVGGNLMSSRHLNGRLLSTHLHERIK